MTNVRQNRRQLLKRAGVFGGIAAVLSPAAALGQHLLSPKTASAQGITEAPIEGSWRVSVTPHGTNDPAPFQALHTFTADKAVTTAEQRDPVPPTFKTPGHGAWTQLPSNDGKDDFLYHYEKLVVDAHGNLVGTEVINIKVELIEGGQAFKGSGTMVFQPSTGNNTAPDAIIMVHATRILS